MVHEAVAFRTNRSIVWIRMNAPRQTLGVWLLMAFAVVITLILAGVLLRLGDSERRVSASHANKSSDKTLQSKHGVTARIVAGGIVVERAFPALSFAIGVGQSLDSRLPAGAFDAEFTVRFQPGDVSLAYLGAEIENASIIIKRGEEIILSDFAGPGGKIALANLPTSLTRRTQQLTYIIKSDGSAPLRLRAMWRPADSDAALPLPPVSGQWLDDPSLKGMVLVQQFNCVGCHASADATLQQQLHTSPGPDLTEIGRRAKPQWLRRWMRDPQRLKHGARMPSMFHGPDGVDEETIEDITHYLVSLGGPIDRSAMAPDPDLISTGMVSYHTIGCVACHGPLEPLENLPGARKTVGYLTQSYQPLGELSRKTYAGPLSEMLRDPLTIYSSGHMPSLALSDLEADSIASYLIANDANHRGDYQEPEFTVDASRADRGRIQFTTSGCANCHSTGPSSSPTTFTAQTLESLSRFDELRGCLSSDAAPTVPQFSFSNSQRTAIVSFLKSLSDRKCDDVPLDRAATTMARLNCAACHAYLDHGGPEPGILQYFTTIEEADLGDEGRLPPTLSDVGAKLNPAWLREVLEGDRRARPYMGVRMPHFGQANVKQLPGDLAACAGVRQEPDHGPASPNEYAALGRELVGSKGLNCIQCHTIAGNESTGTPGPDLAMMTERLRFDNFARWVHDPKRVRPGTRMPSFFVNGKSGFTNILEGNAEDQIRAIWAYLSQGEFLPLPDGLIDQAGLELRVQNEPIVFRTFIKQAGVRAIACGFPEQVHCAFDAEKCRLALVWDGPFLNAKGAWAARGGTQTNPSRVVWTAAEQDVIRIGDTDQDPMTASLRFRGYRLDESRRPIFMYDATAANTTISIAEQLIPSRANGRPKLLRRFVIEGTPGIVLDVLGKRATVNADGRATIDVEVTW
jgi:mono/diheme cytochrome c family protein